MSFLAGEVYAMTGAQATHNTIAGNVFMLIKQALRGTPCRIFFADMKLQVSSADASFYPDVFVSCDPRDRATARPHGRCRAGATLPAADGRSDVRQHSGI